MLPGVALDLWDRLVVLTLRVHECQPKRLLRGGPRPHSPKLRISRPWVAPRNLHFSQASLGCRSRCSEGGVGWGFTGRLPLRRSGLWPEGPPVGVGAAGRSPSSGIRRPGFQTVSSSCSVTAPCLLRSKSDRPMLSTGLASATAGFLKSHSSTRQPHKTAHTVHGAPPADESGEKRSQARGVGLGEDTGPEGSPSLCHLPLTGGGCGKDTEPTLESRWLCELIHTKPRKAGSSQEVRTWCASHRALERTPDSETLGGRKWGDVFPVFGPQDPRPHHFFFY